MKYLSILILLAVPGLAAAQCEGIGVELADDLVRVIHDASYNCAVFDLQHTVALQNDTLVVTELAVADAWADCYCPYNSIVSVAGLEPGSYLLRYLYAETVLEFEPSQWWECVMPFEVLADGADIDGFVVETAESGCGIVVTGVNDGEIHEPSRWSDVKALYR
jgi:hypothetical protein